MNGDLRIILDDAAERIELLLERQRELADDVADALASLLEPGEESVALTRYRQATAQ